MKNILSSKYFKDKVILLLGLILGLLTMFSVISVMLRADGSQSSTILRYWTIQGAAEFEKQSPTELYSFAIFAVLALIIGVYVSYKVYEIYRPASITTLLLAQFLMFSNIIVSGAILNLQQ
ncbi:MAG: hypothetical protein AAF413_04450 [Patescibacteria group bacterium]